MTAGPMTTGRTVPALPPGTAGTAGVPRLADGVELLGEYRDSGYSRPPSLVRRPDGQVIQMSPLLYQVTSRIDGSRDVAAIADLVSADLGRTLTADQVRHLITATLQPQRAANAVALLLRPLFRWPVVVAVTISFAGVDCWLFASHALGAGLQ